MGWSAFWKRVKEVFDAEEASLSTALAKVEPKALPYREPHTIEAVLEPDPPIDLMYNVQGGDGLEPSKLREFMEKSRRRAIRYDGGNLVMNPWVANGGVVTAVNTMTNATTFNITTGGTTGAITQTIFGAVMMPGGAVLTPLSRSTPTRHLPCPSYLRLPRHCRPYRRPWGRCKRDRWTS